MSAGPPLRPVAHGATTWRSTALALVLVLGMLAAVLALTGSEIFDLDRHAVPKELALHLTALIGLVVLLPGMRRLEAGVVATLLGLYVCWSAFSALFATNHWLAFRSWGISFAGLVVFVMARRANDGGRGRIVLGGLALAGVLAALTGVAQAYGLDWALLAGERAPGGTFGNRNFLAHFTVTSIPLVVLVATTTPHRAIRTLALAGLAIQSGAVVLTRSRAAWLALAASLAVMGLAAVFARRHSGLRLRPSLVATMVAGAALALGLPNQLNWRSDSPYSESLRGIVNYQEGSGRGRLIQYRNTLRLVARDPVFGTGPGNWMVLYPTVTTPGDPSYAGADPIPTNPWPSSDWMAFWAERGLAGVLLLLGAGLAAGLTALRRLQDPDYSAQSVALLGLLAAAAVAGLFDAVLLLAAPTLLVFAGIGSLVPATGPVISRSLGRHRWMLTAASLGTGMLLTAQAAGEMTAIVISAETRRREVLAEAVRYDPGNHRLHLILAMRGSCPQRLPHARTAVRLLPFHPYPRRALEACGGRR
jgi:hypothetical protein